MDPALMVPRVSLRVFCYWMKIRAGNAPTYSVTFPAAGNFKFVCLVHADMTGVVHVLDPSETLPHDQDFYDRQAQRRASAVACGRLSPGGPRNS